MVKYVKSFPLESLCIYSTTLIFSKKYIKFYFFNMHAVVLNYIVLSVLKSLSNHDSFRKSAVVLEIAQKAIRSNGCMFYLACILHVHVCFSHFWSHSFSCLFDSIFLMTRRSWLVMWLSTCLAVYEVLGLVPCLSFDLPTSFRLGYLRER